MTDTVATAVNDVVAGLDRLSELGEEIEDEWTYVTELAAAWRERLAEVVAGRGDAEIDEATRTAIDLAIEEADLVRDPHRAIDWLSTLPQVVLVALAEQP